MLAKNSPRNDDNVCKVGQLNCFNVKIDPIKLETPLSSKSFGTTAGFP